MKKIAIVGAGQSGLQLGLGLLAHGYDVTLVSDRPPEAIRQGRILSTQCMFADSLESERQLGLNFWEEECPKIPGVRFNAADPESGDLALTVWGKLDSYAQSVDQRMKMSGWLEELDKQGGSLVVRPVDIELLEELTEDHDLTVVAAGKGEIGSLFEVDPERTPYEGPQRQLAALYVKGYEPLDPPYFAISIVPGVGEYFVGPALTLNGPCYTMCLEALPGGPMDRWRDPELRSDPGALLATCLETLEDHFPWEAARARDVELTDDLATLVGGIPPRVRHATARLPSGNPVMAIGDTAVLNDPLVGQGANNASRSAMIVLRRITEHGDAPLDEGWMRETEARVWDYVKWPTEYTNMMLSPPQHIGDLFAAGAEDQGVADTLANATNDPTLLLPEIRTEEGTRELINKVSAERTPSQ